MKMDELELLKKDWQKQEETLPKLSYDDIYKMIAITGAQTMRA